MVSIVTALLSASLGLLVYLAIPFIVMGSPVEIRKSVGDFYFKKQAKCLKQFSYVRRVLSGYDVLGITVDDEQKLMKCTLDSNLIDEDAEYPFQDPDNRIGRLYNKPVAIAYEEVPAAVDAEVAEWGYWLGKKHVNEGVWSGDLEDPDGVEVDPWLRVSKGLRLVDPIDAYKLVLNDVDAENIKTAEKLTKKRFEKYGGGVSATQLMSGALGFFTGLGGMMALKYFSQKVLGNSGGGTPEAPVPIMLDAALQVVGVVG